MAHSTSSDVSMDKDKAPSGHASPQQAPHPAPASSKPANSAPQADQSEHVSAEKATSEQPTGKERVPDKEGANNTIESKAGELSPSKEQARQSQKQPVQEAYANVFPQRAGSEPAANTRSRQNQRATTNMASSGAPKRPVKDAGSHEEHGKVATAGNGPDKVKKTAASEDGTGDDDETISEESRDGTSDGEETISEEGEGTREAKNSASGRDDNKETSGESASENPIKPIRGVGSGVPIGIHRQDRRLVFATFDKDGTFLVRVGMTDKMGRMVRGLRGRKGLQSEDLRLFTEWKGLANNEIRRKVFNALAERGKIPQKWPNYETMIDEVGSGDDSSVGPSGKAVGREVGGPKDRVTGKAQGTPGMQRTSRGQSQTKTRGQPGNRAGRQVNPTTTASTAEARRSSKRGTAPSMAPQSSKRRKTAQEAAQRRRAVQTNKKRAAATSAAAKGNQPLRSLSEEVSISDKANEQRPSDGKVGIDDDENEDDDEDEDDDKTEIQDWKHEWLRRQEAERKAGTTQHEDYDDKDYGNDEEDEEDDDDYQKEQQQVHQSRDHQYLRPPFRGTFARTTMGQSRGPNCDAGPSTGRGISNAFGGFSHTGHYAAGPSTFIGGRGMANTGRHDVSGSSVPTTPSGGGGGGGGTSDPIVEVEGRRYYVRSKFLRYLEPEVSSILSLFFSSPLVSIFSFFY